MVAGLEKLPCGCCFKDGEGNLYSADKAVFTDLIGKSTAGKEVGSLALIRDPIKKESFLECGCCHINCYREFTSKWKGLCDILSKDGPTAALNMAAYWNMGEAIEVMVNNGVDVNSQKESNGMSALHCAAHNGWLEAAELLLKLGANKSLKNKQDQTPYEIAENLKRQNCLEILKV